MQSALYQNVSVSFIVCSGLKSANLCGHIWIRRAARTGGLSWWQMRGYGVVKSVPFRWRVVYREGLYHMHLRGIF